ncbi:MAG TPA: ATP-dependent helicase HrpB, partial [Desulfuromonadales bacterium]|nr:ATP-dependent helicase HrpB [Desulfuromonadales bacterium]
MAERLPIDEVLPRLKIALREHPAAVLQAPPGAGKTTRVPLELLREPWLAGQSIVMLEPRRLAATSAARFMAGQLGEKVGETVGYSIRYDTCRSRRTRIEVVTEGVLTRRLQNDPELKGIGLVVFDEFHERNLNSDLALALCHDARQGLREDLRILVMSATLDGEPIAKLLGGAPLVTSAGRSYPVEIRYRDRDPEGRPADIAAAAVRKALGEADGDILVFLPGTGDIRHCETLLQGVESIDVLPLYGALSFDEQERAIVPGTRRRVVLSTNIAETSLTIEGIQVVIDSGYARQPRFEPGAGLTRLETVRISRASADQRAGRAGRLGPGVCYRLWSEGRHGSLLPFTPPEIRNADLSSVVLNLARWGVNDPEELAWLDPPPAGSVQGARQLLQWLGAMDGKGRLSRIGEEMADLPAHPRVARLLVQARRDGCGRLGCDLAALLGERDIFAHRKGTSRMSGSDLHDRIEAFRREPGRVPAVQRSARYWRRLLGVEADS